MARFLQLSFLSSWACRERLNLLNTLELKNQKTTRRGANRGRESNPLWSHIGFCPFCEFCRSDGEEEMVGRNRGDNNGGVRRNGTSNSICWKPHWLPVSLGKHNTVRDSMFQSVLTVSMTETHTFRKSINLPCRLPWRSVAGKNFRLKHQKNVCIISRWCSTREGERGEKTKWSGGDEEKIQAESERGRGRKTVVEIELLKNTLEKSSNQ